MVINKINQNASWWQKGFLFLSLMVLFLFGVAADKPAESDCCQGPECEIWLNPNRIENLGFGKTAYVSLQMSCDVDAVEYLTKGGRGLNAEIAGNSIKVTAQDISSLDESKKMSFSRFHATTRSKSFKGMAHYAGYLVFKDKANIKLDQILFDSGSFVGISARYEIDGKIYIAKHIVPVSFDIQEIQTLFDELYPDSLNAD